MSDNATLVERLEGPHEWGYRDIADGGFVADDTPYEAATEICNQATEIEAERDYNRAAHDSATLRISQLTKTVRELEAERDKLKAELAKAGHDFVAIERIARAALSDPSGEKP